MKKMKKMAWRRGRLPTIGQRAWHAETAPQVPVLAAQWRRGGRRGERGGAKKGKVQERVKEEGEKVRV